MIGLDTGYLVALSVREHPLHQACLALFEDEIRGRSGSMALMAQVLAEFAHVVTDARRFERPLAMPEALDLCSLWWHAGECRQVMADFDAGTLFLGWMESHRLGRKRLLDTLLAASYYRAGVHRIATTGRRDFATYGVFDIIALGD